MCAVLSKYWPSGYFSVTLNGLLVSPNCQVQKIHFTDFFFCYRNRITTCVVRKKNKIARKIVSEELGGRLEKGHTSNDVLPKFLSEQQSEC